MSQNIQWFPGHMAKARREAQEKINLVDIVIELVDARIPLSSRNPVIQEIIGNKDSIILLNKSDLADPVMTKRWLEYFRAQKLQALDIDAQHNKGINQLQSRLRQMMAPHFEKMALKGMKPRSIRLMILGIPNVGKSTLINRFVGKNQAITGNKPGVTKAQRWLKIGKDFELLDTPGILWPKFEKPEEGIKLGITGAIKDSLLPMDDLALAFIEFLRSNYPDDLNKYAKISVECLTQSSPVDLLMIMTRNMGFKEDYDQAAIKIIQDYRQQKIGRISLDILSEKGRIIENS